MSEYMTATEAINSYLTKIGRIRKKQMTNSRVKGSSGERELFKLLGEELGLKLNRNLSQTRGGGSDTLDLPNWSVEVKRCEKLNIPAFWAQTLEQSKKENKKPILFYRQSRQQWQAVVRLSDINPDLVGDYIAIIYFDAACLLIRESL